VLAATKPPSLQIERQIPDFHAYTAITIPKKIPIKVDPVSLTIPPIGARKRPLLLVRSPETIPRIARVRVVFELAIAVSLKLVSAVEIGHRHAYFITPILPVSSPAHFG